MLRWKKEWEANIESQLKFYSEKNSKKSLYRKHSRIYFAPFLKMNNERKLQNSKKYLRQVYIKIINEPREQK